MDPAITPITRTWPNLLIPPTSLVSTRVWVGAGRNQRRPPPNVDLAGECRVVALGVDRVVERAGQVLPAHPTARPVVVLHQLDEVDGVVGPVAVGPDAELGAEPEIEVPDLVE